MNFLASILALVISLAIWPGSDPFEIPKLVVASTLLIGIALLKLSTKSQSSFRRTGDQRALGTLLLPGMALLASYLLSTMASGFSRTSWLGSEAGADGLWAALVGLATVFLVAGTHRRLVLSAWIAGCALAALYGIAQRLGLDPIPWHGENLSALNYRVFGPLGNPSFLAMLLSMGIPVGLLLAIELKGSGRRAVIFAVAVISFTLPLTMSRIGIFAGILGVAEVWLFVSRSRPSRGGTFIPLVCSLFLFLGFLASGIEAPQSAAGRFAELGDPSRGSVAVRVELYRAGIEASMAKPLLGWGPGNTVKALKQSTSASLTEEQRYNPSFHNFLLDALVQRGAFGLFATVWFIVAAAQLIRSSKEPLVRAGIGYAAIAFLVNSLVGFATVGPWFSMCLLLGLAIPRPSLVSDPHPESR